MDAMQPYFGYAAGGCGIRNVYFMGTLEDWQKLRKKIENLKNIKGLLSNGNWINIILFIVDQWIECYQGNVNLDFWNKMVDLVHNEFSYSITAERTVFTGWILALAEETELTKTFLLSLIRCP